MASRERLRDRRSEPLRHAKRQSLLRFGKFVLDEERYELLADGGPIELQPQPFRLLAYLVRNHERVVSRAELFRELWPGVTVSDAALSSALNATRRAIGDDDGSRPMLRTLRGRGIRFVARVERVHSERPDKTPNTQRPAHRDESPPQTSLAVLPLERLTTDPEQVGMAIGLHEEITTRLAQSHSVMVKACTFTSPYSDRSVPAVDLAHALGVRYLVEGSIRSSNGLARLALRLVDAVSGFTLWASALDEPVRDVIELQGRLAERAVQGIDDALQETLTRDTPSGTS